MNRTFHSGYTFHQYPIEGERKRVIRALQNVKIQKKREK